MGSQGSLKYHENRDPGPHFFYGNGDLGPSFLTSVTVCGSTGKWYRVDKIYCIQDCITYNIIVNQASVCHI